MEEMVQRSQPAMRSLDCHPWQWCHIWGLVLASALSRYVTQKQLYSSQPWWIVFSCLKIMPKLLLFHHSNIFYGTLDNCRDGKEKGLTVQVWIILSTWLLNTSSAEAAFWWVFTWKTNYLHIHYPFEEINKKFLPQMPLTCFPIIIFSCHWPWSLYLT